MNAPAPLTHSGLTVVVVGVVAYVGGWRLGWVELMVLAAGAAVSLAFAAPFVIGRLRLDVTRDLEPERVMVGETSVAIVHVKNPARSGARPRLVEDRVAKSRVLIEVPALRAGGSHQAVYPLPTSKRGAYQVGPAVIARQDPLRLLRREVPQTASSTLWVHPRYAPLPALPVGFARDLEGPTSDNSPHGDVAFHALREYQPGDDFRHIHWLSTARVGVPMVRHYVDNRRPQLTVLLDDRSTSLGPDEFEVAVEIAASLAVSALLHRQPVSLWTTLGPVVGHGKPGGRDDILDRLAVAGQSMGAALDRAALHAVRNENGTSAIVIVTGDVDTVELALTTSKAKRHAKVVIARVWPFGRSRPGSIPGARVLDVESLVQFSRSWDRITR